MRFGKYLIKKNVIDKNQLVGALQTQKYFKNKIGRILVELGHLSKDEQNRHLQQFLNSKLDLGFKELLERIKIAKTKDNIKKWINDNSLILLEDQKKLTICLSLFFKDEVIQDFEENFNKDLSVKCIRKEVFQLVKESLKPDQVKKESSIRIDSNETPQEKINKDSPYMRLFRDIILHARKVKASDIHIEPLQEGVKIILRINGDLKTFKVLELDHKEGFINEVKNLSKLSIAKYGKTQDASIMFPSWKLNIRASLVPSLYGESIVLRLLDQDKRFDLKEINLSKDNIESLQKAVLYKNGLILLSGPTGSGKTTTLFSLLNYLNSGIVSIKTIEDPIEYTIDGITQIEVTKRLKFADILRAVLRQDPDIILVGEIRDEETAKICLKAASTGHLVLSTIHANGAKENISRLKQFGIDAFEIIENLRFSAAQRLIKRACSLCSRTAKEQEKMLFNNMLQKNAIEVSYDKDPLIKEMYDCPECTNSGRIPIIEYMNSFQIKEYVQTGSVDLDKSLLRACIERVTRQEACLKEALSYG